MELRGIGEYSAELVMPKMGFPLDVWSAKIFQVLFFGKEPQKPREIIPALKEAAAGTLGRMERLRFCLYLKRLGKAIRKGWVRLNEILSFNQDCTPRNALNLSVGFHFCCYVVLTTVEVSPCKPQSRLDTRLHQCVHLKCGQDVNRLGHK